VRAARALCPSLAAADSPTALAFPAWALVAPSFDLAGMRILDPTGPNGWKEHLAWLNSNTVRFRTRLAAALALGETASSGGAAYRLFPTSVDDWFPVVPAAPGDVLARLVALLQPAPLDAALTSGWLSSLWPSGFAWDDDGKRRARELALMILSSPAAQQY